MKKTVSFLLAALLLLTLVLPALALEAQCLPTEVPKWDPADYYKCMLQGLYEADITYDNVTRPMHLYYPDGLLETCPVVLITAPAGCEAANFIEESGWKQIAEANGVVLGIMTAKEWSPEDVAYVTAMRDYFSTRPFISNRQNESYMAAYDEAGAGLSYALQHPTSISAILSVGCKGISADVLMEIGEQESGFFSATDNQPIPQKEMIWPLWLVTDDITADVEALINYVKVGNRITADANMSEVAENTVYYAPNLQAFSGWEFEPVAGIHLTKMPANQAICYEFANAVWENLFDRMRRYPSYGEIRSYVFAKDENSGYKRYDAMVYGGDFQDENGITVPGTYYSRYWLTYVPEKAKNQKDVPVLFLNHGNGASPYECGEKYGWRKIADEYGFIMILPQGSLNYQSEVSQKNGVNYYQALCTWSDKATASKPNDLLFYDYLFHWATTEWELKDQIDLTRCFVTGHSMGGAWTYILLQTRPQYFAAAAPSSAIGGIRNDRMESVDIPVFNAMGQKDPTIKGGFSGTADTNAVFGNGQTVFHYFADRYQVVEPQGRHWEDFTFLDADAICTQKDQMMNLYIYNTPKTIPMFTAVEVVGMRHATIPTFCEYFFKTAMTHFTRNLQTKVLYYDGEVVDTPVNMELFNNSNLK